MRSEELFVYFSTQGDVGLYLVQIRETKKTEFFLT